MSVARDVRLRHWVSDYRRGEALRGPRRDTNPATRGHITEDLNWQINLLRNGKKVRIKFAVEQAMKAQRWSRGLALLFL